MPITRFSSSRQLGNEVGSSPFSTTKAENASFRSRMATALGPGHVAPLERLEFAENVFRATAHLRKLHRALRDVINAIGKVYANWTFVQ